MDLLLLAGNSIHNKEWIHTVKKILSPLFKKSLVHEYAHWQNGELDIDLEAELKSLDLELKSSDSYYIFAKSVGSILTLKGMDSGQLKPLKVVIAGLPLGLIKESVVFFNKWLENNKVPLLIIQNTNDPLGSFLEVKKYLQELNLGFEYEIIEVPGDDHSYNDLVKLKELVSNFIRK